mmetsp:Transcript_13857/g.15622  ORF Transcript_13857/g.15622 Transcript_13857/m.15622 type:complete len:508 (-) Transcript_13857:170-1693(-)
MLSFSRIGTNFRKTIAVASLILYVFVSCTTLSDAAFMSSSGQHGQYRSLSSSSTMNQSNSKFLGRGMKLQQPTSRRINSNNKNQRTTLGMFLGADGILGVGAPEVAVTLLVGYFVLGPSDLYKLTKEIGKFIQSIRTLSTEATKTFESTMEENLELQEIRKAQSELSGAFNFRRSINVDQQGDAFSELPPIAVESGAAAVAAAEGGVAAAATDTGTPLKKKKIRRRVKKKKKKAVDEEAFNMGTGEAMSGNIPDLDMSEVFTNEMREELYGKGITDPMQESEAEVDARLRQERIDRLQNGQPSSSTMPDWATASESDIASEVLSQKSESEVVAENSRFANQLNGDWNAQILANEDELSPIATIMERLALLEEEKNAADARLEEEFRLRSDNEERFYSEKRKLLEEASIEIQASAYNLDVSSETSVKLNDVPETKEKDVVSETSVKPNDNKSEAKNEKDVVSNEKGKKVDKELETSEKSETVVDTSEESKLVAEVSDVSEKTTSIKSS